MYEKRFKEIVLEKRYITSKAVLVTLKEASEKNGVTKMFTEDYIFFNPPNKKYFSLCQMVIDDGCCEAAYIKDSQNQKMLNRVIDILGNLNVSSAESKEIVCLFNCLFNFISGDRCAKSSQWNWSDFQRKLFGLEQIFEWVFKLR